MFQPDLLSQLTKLIGSTDDIALISHHNPDGDAIGSALGMYHVLTNLSKRVNVILPNQLPEFLQWMPGAGNIHYYKSNKDLVCDLLSKAGLVIMLDFNEANRVGKMEECINNITAPVILIDHHPGPKVKAEVTISFTEVSSTAELVFEVIDSAGWKDKLDTNAATCLFTGILTDTISFSVNSSRPRTFEIVSNLLSYNINKDEIYRLVFNTFSEKRMRLLGHLLSQNMVVMPQYKSAYITLSLEEAQKYNFQPGDSEGFVNYPLNIKGIVFSAFIMERKDHIKLSFRSRGSFAVNKLMEEHFTGGGHVNASGGEVHGQNMKDVVEKLMSVLPLYKDLCE